MPSPIWRAEATQPIPKSSTLVSASARMSALAAARPRAGSRASSRAARVSSAACRPACWPPMPSITANRPRSGRQSYASWLSGRTVPRWVRAAARSVPLERGPVLSSSGRACCLRSIALNAVDRELHLPVGQRDVHGEAIHGNLAAGLDEPARHLDRVGLREAPDDHTASSRLDPELPLVDLGAGPGQRDEARGGGLVGTPEHRRHAGGHAG